MSILGERVPYRNDTGEAIPPYGVVRLREVLRISPDRRLCYKAEKPFGTPGEELYVNGQIEVRPGKFGVAESTATQFVAYDDADGVPVVGHPWGVEPVADTPGGFTLRKWRGGFVVLQAPVSGAEAVLVRRVACHEYWGRLAETLVAGELDAPETADVTLWIPSVRPDSNPIEYQASAITATAVNRDPSLSGGTDTNCRVKWLNGEWSFTWVAC